jgi:coenzyme F420-reducing hydrogenase delta subunit
MQPRSDGKAYEIEAVVDPALCMSCGLCTGACPTATPFRHHSGLVPGIDMPDLPAAALRESILQAAGKLAGERRILVFGCRENAQTRRMKAVANDAETASLDLICSGHLPPPFVDFILSRNLADGIVVAGCPGGDCQYRFGTEWTSLRMARQRDPHLRKRVDSARLALAWEDPWQGCKDLPGVVAALRATLPTTRQPGAPSAPRRPSRGLRLALAGAAYAVFFALVAWLSVWPRFQLIDAGHAMVSLSFSHAGQRIRECRKLTQEELNKLPPNMRKPEDCPRERLPVRVFFAVDDTTLYEATLAPTGLWNDGSANIYRRLEVPAGTQELFIGMNERGQADGFDFSLAQVVDLAPGQHVVVEFDDQRKSFEFRLE